MNEVTYNEKVEQIKTELREFGMDEAEFTKCLDRRIAQLQDQMYAQREDTDDGYCSACVL